MYNDIKFAFNFFPSEFLIGFEKHKHFVYNKRPAGHNYVSFAQLSQQCRRAEFKNLNAELVALEFKGGHESRSFIRHCF